MKLFSYLLKQTVIIFVYLIVTMVTAFAIALITNKNLVWLQIILWILNLGLFGFIIFVMMMKTGEDSYKLKHSNDIKRKVVMETGEYFNFQTAKEYGKWKGLYIGFIVMAPLVLLCIIELVLNICGIKTSITSTIAVIIYGTFCVPLRFFNNTIAIYWFLYSSIPICLITYFGYYFGVRKIKKQYDKIKRTNEMIYGKKSK